jgi:menaquinone-9 beta-reductase
MYHSMCSTDVFVCGGGPAGIAAAIAARAAGFDVMLADPAQPPIDKACGEGIMPDGLAVLERLGIRFGASVGMAFRGIRFVDPAGTADAFFPHGRGLGVRRTVLHDALVRRAADLSIAMQWGVRVSSLAHDGVCINGQKVRARWVVCADGQRSRLRDLAGLSQTSRMSQRLGFRRHYHLVPWTNSVEVYWSDAGQMYVTPVGPEELCVAFVTRSETRFDEALPKFPGLASQLAGAPFAPYKGAVTASRKLRRVQRGSVALVGEASGSVDAVTGEGLSLAFQQALALAEAMKGGDLAHYEKAHRRIMRLPNLMSGLMLNMDKHPGFRRRVFRTFASEPTMFTRLLALHTGDISPLQFGLHDTLSLAWRLATA